MQTTIDEAGRLVIPKALRDQVGLRPGAVEITADGAAIRIEAIVTDELVEEDGLLLLPDVDEPIDPDTSRDLRLADQR